MGVYKYLSKSWRKDETPFEVRKERLIAWRSEPATIRVEHPTRLNRAKALGYKAKQGFFIVRQCVSRGGHTRPTWAGGRRSRNMSPRMNLRKNYQLIAEERAAKKFVNCEVLNSYYADQDGKQFWFEVILADKAHPNVKASLDWIAEPKHTGRVFRGLTSAGRKVRGLRHKGMGSEKTRPSRRANDRRL